VTIVALAIEQCHYQIRSRRSGIEVRRDRVPRRRDGRPNGGSRIISRSRVLRTRRSRSR
jgi:hypothetical protein